MESVLSAKLDRLAVGSILKQVNEVFLLSVLLMRTQVRISHRRYISCCWDSAEYPNDERRWMGIDNESDQVE